MKPLSNNSPNACRRLTRGSPKTSDISQFHNNQVGIADSAAKIDAMTTIQSTTAKNFTFRLVEEAMLKLEQEKSPGCNLFRSFRSCCSKHSGIPTAGVLPDNVSTRTAPMLR
jgi:hypothetical protein